MINGGAIVVLGCFSLAVSERVTIGGVAAELDNASFAVPLDNISPRSSPAIVETLVHSSTLTSLIIISL